MEKHEQFAKNFDETQTVSEEFNRSLPVLHSENHVSNGPKINDVTSPLAAG
jgi:hypothetical protein